MAAFQCEIYLFVLSIRTCFRWNTAPTLTQHQKLQFVNSSQGWRSSFQSQISNRQGMNRLLCVECMFNFHLNASLLALTDCVLDQCCTRCPGGVHAMRLKRRRPEVSSPEQAVPWEASKELCWYVCSNTADSTIFSVKSFTKGGIGLSYKHLMFFYEGQSLFFFP